MMRQGDAFEPASLGIGRRRATLSHARVETMSTFVDRRWPIRNDVKMNAPSATADSKDMLVIADVDKHKVQYTQILAIKLIIFIHTF